jgi:hypothetical protein
METPPAKSLTDSKWLSSHRCASAQRYVATASKNAMKSELRCSEVCGEQDQLTLATRYIKDFEDFGTELVDPWGG